MKYYQVNIPSIKPVFTNSKKVKKQLEENARLVMEQMAFKVYWNEPKTANEIKIARVSEEK